MNPLSLTLRNCRTFRDITVEIPEGLLAILGANGAGKSTLINAIDIALFGPESRTLADWYPRGDANIDALQIELVFEHAGETYRVRRSYSPKGRGSQSKLDLEHWLIAEAFLPGRGDADDDYVERAAWEPLTLESQTATQEQIESLIGLSRDTFRASSFLAQNEAGVFCEAQPRQRKQILAEIVGTDDWVPYHERARASKRGAESTLDQIAGSLDRAEAELARREEVEQERAQAHEQAALAEGALNEAVAAVAAAREGLQEQQTRVEARRNAEIALHRANQDLGDLQARIRGREESVEALDQRLEERPYLESIAADAESLEQEREMLTVALNQWEQRQVMVIRQRRLMSESEDMKAKASGLRERAAAVLAGVGSEKCDRCGQTLHEDAARRAADSYEQEANELDRRRNSVDEQELPELDEQIASLHAVQPDPSRLQELPALIATARGAVTALARLTETEGHRRQHLQELEEMRAGLPERERAASNARDALEALGPHDPDVTRLAEAKLSAAETAERDIRATVDNARAQTARCDERLERLNQIAAEASVERGRRDSLLTDLDLYATLERACGPNGVPALILETAIPQIEVEATRILGRLGGPAYATELHTQRETKSGTVADALDIVLLTEAGEAPYEAFSGGEKARIAFALRLALAQMLASRKGAATGLLVIDELAGLDAAGVAALVGVLEDLQRHVPRIVCVSHQAELRDAFPQAILLENVDGKSRIVNA